LEIITHQTVEGIQSRLKRNKLDSSSAPAVRALKIGAKIESILKESSFSMGAMGFADQR
jgi:hypothetical protein